jgi:hypothetical protein
VSTQGAIPFLAGLASGLLVATGLINIFWLDMAGLIISTLQVGCLALILLATRRVRYHSFQAGRWVMRAEVHASIVDAARRELPAQQWYEEFCQQAYAEAAVEGAVPLVEEPKR